MLNKKIQNSRFKIQNSRKGLSVVELMITICIAIIPFSAAGVLLVSGQRGWEKTYYSAHRQIKADAQAVTAALGNIGRRSDRDNCVIYVIYKSGSSIAAVPVSASGDSTVSGQAVEFRYWDGRGASIGREAEPTFGQPPTCYARFYLFYPKEEPEKPQLRVDYGPYPYSDANREVTRTVVFADNVTEIQFSRATLNGVGQGCVRMDMTLTDRLDGETITVRAATLMRN